MLWKDEAQSYLFDEMKIPFYTCSKMRNFVQIPQVLRQVAKFRFLDNFRFCENRPRTTVSQNHRHIFGLENYCSNIPNFCGIKCLAEILWTIVFSYVNIFIRSMCLTHCGASEAVYPCNVVEKIHEYFRSKMRQYL
jgi:hypothetical protein